MATEIEVFQGNQIGGCVTVITCTYQGKTSRIMIDYGANLPGSKAEVDFAYPWAEKPVDAVLFTHYHGDHVGRILQIPENLPTSLNWWKSKSEMRICAHADSLRQSSASPAQS